LRAVEILDVAGEGTER